MARNDCIKGKLVKDEGNQKRFWGHLNPLCKVVSNLDETGIENILVLMELSLKITEHHSISLEICEMIKRIKVPKAQI